MQYNNIREEELKNRVAADFFWQYDCAKIIGNVDFCVTMIHSGESILEQESLLWAEAKTGSSDIYKSIVQLVLTIGKARTFDKFLPPVFLGAFDGEKMAFIAYNDIHDVFYINDFNWNITPSDYSTKEFNLIQGTVKSAIEQNALLFNFANDKKELINFIRQNLHVCKYGLSKIRIDKSNFMIIYNKWLAVVKPTIAVNWAVAEKSGIIDGDFYLADLLSQDNVSLKDKLFVVLNKTKYEFNRFKDQFGAFTSSAVEFNDKQTAHNQFWNKYERPPKEEYWEYIVGRRDLLVPQDVRERKGSFFTPLVWVELSQRYLTDRLGEDWQDEYYVWDCAAGTGNLLIGLTNKYNIWASTLDKQDVEVMRDRIKNGANLLESHVFQFDFLNDDFSKLPQPLQDIINDPEKRKKLVIYINPPYAEATSSKTAAGTGENKAGVATDNKVNEYYKAKIGNASNEIFALFMAKIYDILPNSILAQFSKLKFIQGSNFDKFKEFFLAKFMGGFIVPADTFDNVKGSFPIGFTIWNLNVKKSIKNINCDIYDRNHQFAGKKMFYGKLPKSINKWLAGFYDSKNFDIVGTLSTRGNDFQNQKYIYLAKKIENNVHDTKVSISKSNLITISIYFAVRHCIEATWLNDRDQFLYPNNGWKNDTGFQNDCLAFVLFHGQNRISSCEGTNNWIPFTEKEVNAREKFDSHFMTNFIKGKTKYMAAEVERYQLVFREPEAPYDLGNQPIVFSETAKDVFDAGKELWSYYHSQPNANPNASLYDIREHFQGRNSAGKMNNKSQDEQYKVLIADLRDKLKILAMKIEPKVYEYGFLKR